MDALGHRLNGFVGVTDGYRPHVSKTGLATAEHVEDSVTGQDNGIPAFALEFLAGSNSDSKRETLHQWVSTLQDLKNLTSILENLHSLLTINLRLARALCQTKLIYGHLSPPRGHALH